MPYILLGYVAELCLMLYRQQLFQACKMNMTIILVPSSFIEYDTYYFSLNRKLLICGGDGDSNVATTVYCA
jgi:hypothetical protein